VDDALLVGRLGLVSGAGRSPRLFYSTPRLYERFYLWLDLSGAMEGLDATDDGLFGTSSRRVTRSWVGSSK
jgi:hypothetical protein